MLCLFSDLALGTRFQYTGASIEDEIKIWTKISANTIAEWDESLKADNWVGQSVCCFTDNFDTDIYVRVL